jgi:pyridoxine kinase
LYTAAPRAQIAPALCRDDILGYTRGMNVLSIHSSVVLGHVGNSGAQFALQRQGHEVWPIATVALSNHPAHGSHRGRVVPTAEISELVRGLTERGSLARCDAFLSGYLGDAAQGPAVLDAWAGVQAANPRALWLLDPVIGDRGRRYVGPGIAEFLRDRAIAHAHILTPNAFELEFLTGRTADTTVSALAAIDMLRQRATRPQLVVATGLALTDRPPGDITVLAADETGAWRLAVPAIDHPAYGAGDIFAALLLSRLLLGDAAPEALSHAASAVYGVLVHSPRGDAELALIAAQDELVVPRRRVLPERLR